MLANDARGRLVAASVAPGSLAEQKGVRVGAVVREVDGADIRSQPRMDVLRRIMLGRSVIFLHDRPKSPNWATLP